MWRVREFRSGRNRPERAGPAHALALRPNGEREPGPCGASGSRGARRQGAPASRPRLSGGSRHQLGKRCLNAGTRRIRGGIVRPTAAGGQGRRSPPALPHDGPASCRSEPAPIRFSRPETILLPQAAARLICFQLRASPRNHRSHHGGAALARLVSERLRTHRVTQRHRKKLNAINHFRRISFTLR